MRAWKAEEFGAPDVLTLQDIEIPDPAENQIEVEVLAAGVGLPDFLMTAGNYPAVQVPPVTPGQEVAGVVTKVGPGADFKVGDRVMTSTLFAQGSGGFAERCLGNTSMTTLIPDGLPVEQAAGFLVPYHTAYVGLVQRGELKEGEILLVLGGSGSSGSAAIQLGKALGATVIATASSDEKADFCRDLGADDVINHRETAIHHAMRDITGGVGPSIVYDPVGGSAYEQATKCVAQYGRIILIGYGSGSWAKVDPLHCVLRSYNIVGAFAGATTPDENKQHQAHMNELIAAGKIKVPVDKVFPFDQVPQAIARVGKGQMLGKVIVSGAS
ncbi:MAG: NADPH:quinone oxidoreductase family protein [Alphaproteobacteria bacterium]